MKTSLELLKLANEEDVRKEKEIVTEIEVRIVNAIRKKQKGFEIKTSPNIYESLKVRLISNGYIVSKQKNNGIFKVFL